jgi:hypothetical protein
MMADRRRESIRLVCNGYARAGHRVVAVRDTVGKDVCAICVSLTNTKSVRVQIRNYEPFTLVTLCDNCLSTFSIGATDTEALPSYKLRGLAAICKGYVIAGERTALTGFRGGFSPSCFMCGIDLTAASSKVMSLGRYSKLYFDEPCISPFIAEMELRWQETAGRLLLLRMLPLNGDTIAVIGGLLCAAWTKAGGVYDAMFP